MVLSGPPPCQKADIRADFCQYRVLSIFSQKWLLSIDLLRCCSFFSFPSLPLVILTSSPLRLTQLVRFDSIAGQQNPVL